MVCFTKMTVKEERCGVYIIINLTNGHYYIGSSSNLRSRFNGHNADLRNNHHDARHLQFAYNKYGDINFIFDVLEFCEEKSKLKQEQYYLDNFKPWDQRLGYNSAKFAGSPGKGREVTPEERKRSSEANKGRKKPEGYGAIVSKHWEDNYDWLVDIHIKRSGKKIVLISPENKVVEVFGVNRFCKANSLDHVCILKLLRWELSEHRGWKAPLDQIKEVIKITDINGTDFEIDPEKIRAFSECHDITVHEVHFLHKETLKIIRGWTKTGNGVRKQIISPTGELYNLPLNGYGLFFKAHGLSKWKGAMLMQGKQKEADGWRTKEINAQSAI